MYKRNWFSDLREAKPEISWGVWGIGGAVRLSSVWAEL